LRDVRLQHVVRGRGAERSATPALCFANPPQVRLAEKIESLKEKKEFLTAETTNNREIETQITAAERVQHK
jgi:hypothetical protein